ncbi:MAG: FdtA/QdtA family cupin domain-containing protein [Spirosomataceae bacterium]
MTSTDKPSLMYFNSIGSAHLGFITVTEPGLNMPFEIKRVYWTYYTPQNVQRGGHAHFDLHQLIFAVSGKITFYTETLAGQKDTFVLEEPNVGLYIPNLVWRDITFSHSAVLLCLASDIYKSSDYIRSYEQFQSLRSS